MNCARGLALAMLLCGCTTVGPFVKSVRVEGTDLVLERCEIRRIGGSLTEGDCTTERRRLPDSCMTYQVTPRTLPTVRQAPAAAPVKPTAEPEPIIMDPLVAPPDAETP